WGRNESKAVARDLENPGATDDPFWGTFASYFYDHDNNSATAYTFEMLFEDYNENDYDWKANSNTANSNVQRAVVNEPDMLAWAPSILFTGTGADEKIIISFVQASSSFAPSDHDQEVFVKYWNGTDEAWQSYGLGSDSNGNPLASQYPTDGLSSGDVAYFEFNADSTDQYDVVMAVPDEDGTNEGQMYVYNRYSGAWSTKTPTAAAEEFNTIDSDGDGTFGIGRVFDLDGEPEIEYNDITNGTPIVAFLDDTNGMPFVYKYTVSYGWLPVGSYLGVDGQAGGVAGNVDADDNVGIDAQVGPGGKILVAYVATDDNNNIIESDDFDYVVTRIYDPVSDTWSDAYDGRLTTDS
ncbi:MAG: hypothetical protein JXM68_05315, partial [Sedimentisphaerales bacterium]|nr:hypothetical protein [Sedimentisphaerales bacterium]